jgi:hypothetical protein
MRLPNGAVLTVAFLLVAAASPAQSLGDAAAKEKARRKTVAKPTKVINDDDLRTGGGVVSGSGTEGVTEGTASGTPGEGGAAGASGKKEKSEEEARAEAQADWRKKLDTANQQAAQARDLVSQVQVSLNDTSGGVYTPRRAALFADLEEAKKRQAAADQKVADLTEQGRRNGYR